MGEQVSFHSIGRISGHAFIGYLVVKELAKVHQNVSFIGDLDQTIYSWRGSQPVFFVQADQKHFPAVPRIIADQ